MKTIVYYISEYGYGHASRSIAIIRELLNRNQSLNIIVCNQFALPFLKESLKEFGQRVIFHEIKTDVGYVLEQGTIQLNHKEMNEQYRAYMDTYPQLVESECQYLQSFSPCGILSDISPLAHAVGEALGIRTVGISNFTWASACKDILEKDIYRWLLNQYNQADFFYRLAGFNEELHVPYQNVGFFSRKFDEDEVIRLQQEYKINPDETVIFFSIGMKIDLAELSQWPLWQSENCRFILSHNMKVHHPKVINIPVDYMESQNFLALSDIVITKAGWGTVSEAVTNGKRLLIINRDMNEDQNTLTWLQSRALADVIEYSDLKKLSLHLYRKKIQ